jgi:galactose-1-phosphate uridylyltransferase
MTLVSIVTEKSKEGREKYYVLEKNNTMNLNRAKMKKNVHFDKKTNPGKFNVTVAACAVKL